MVWLCEPNILFNFCIERYGEHLCKTILDKDKSLFKDFSIFNYVGLTEEPFDAIVVECYIGNIQLKLFKIWPMVKEEMLFLKNFMDEGRT